MTRDFLSSDSAKEKFHRKQAEKFDRIHICDEQNLTRSKRK